MSDTKKLVIVVTNGFDNERSSVAWSVANGGIGMGFEVTMFLVSSGVDWVRKGAGDVRGIRAWLESGSAGGMISADRQLRQFAPALMALAAGSWWRAGLLLQAMMPEISNVGGSSAQNTLFERLAEWCARQDAEYREQRNAA